MLSRCEALSTMVLYFVEIIYHKYPLTPYMPIEKKKIFYNLFAM